METATTVARTEKTSSTIRKRKNLEKAISTTSFLVSSTEDARRVVSEIRGRNHTEENQELSSRVAKILLEVRKRGDQAVLEFSSEFDSVALSDPRELWVTQEEMELATKSLGKKEYSSLKKAYSQIYWLAKQQMQRYAPRRYKTPLGFLVDERFEPLRRIGGYVPGGLAAYPSTVLMICAAARAAGVEEIILTTPPAKNGIVSASILAAAAISGVGKILKLGGAQAIAALAFGTETIPKVDLIAGPGNQYVTEAKRQVAASGFVSIDIPAGPTELLILGDKKADPTLVAEDLISQAEHGNKTLCGLVSDSKELISKVQNLLGKADSRKRSEQIAQCYLFTVKVASMMQAVEFAEEFAPEHLEVVGAERIARGIRNAGLVLVGDYTPCSSTDYIVGTNHVLPTGGYARRQAGLSVDTFLKRITVVRGSKTSLKKSKNPLSIIAELEGLPNHGIAAQSRFRES